MSQDRHPLFDQQCDGDWVWLRDRYIWYYYYRLYGTTTDYMVLLQTIWYYYRLYGTTTDYMVLLQIYMVLLQTIWYYYRLYGTTTDYMVLLQTIWYYYRLYGTTTDIYGTTTDYMVLLQIYMVLLHTIRTHLVVLFPNDSTIFSYDQ